MIPVRNVYYMLAYAFQVLNEAGYKSLAVEEFNNVSDLCAAILDRGVSLLIRRGLNRDYLPKQEPLSMLKGKMDITDSIKRQTMPRGQMSCVYDEYTENNYLNRILKSVMLLLIRSDISGERKKRLRRHLLCFRTVDETDVRRIDWKQRFDSSSRHYRTLISVCRLAAEGLLQTQTDGSVRLMDFLDEQRMCRLYEKFILEFCRKEHRDLQVSAPQIPWALDDGIGDLLPVMQSDIMLRRGSAVLIIDAKYYSHTMREQYGTHTLHSGNLYQIFAYVKNTEARLQDQPHTVSGMLLYAGTDEQTLPDRNYRMSGNRICVKTLDLNRSFPDIAAQLNGIIAEFFPPRPE